MTRLLPWSSAEIGDLDVFTPAVPCLLVNTWYIDGQPESTVSHFWQDEATGMIHHELLLDAPISYEEAIEWGLTHASNSEIERIHVRHARARAAGRSAGRKKVGQKGKPARSPSGKRHAAKRRAVKRRAGGPAKGKPRSAAAKSQRRR